MEQPADESQREHISTLQYRLVVHAAVSKTVLHHFCYRTSNHSVAVDAHLGKIVICLELSFLKVVWSERIGVDDDSCMSFCILILSLKSRSVHRNQYVALVAWSQNFSFSNVNLKSTDTSQRAFAGANVGRIVRKGRDSVSDYSRNC